MGRELATTRSFAAEALDPKTGELSLLVVERTSSRLVALPPVGFRVIGRDVEADVRVDDPSASRRHARLQMTDEGVRLIDLDSRNGLRVNGARIDGACDLSPGDVVTIGDVALILRPSAHARPRRALLAAQEILPRIQHEIDRSKEAVRPLSLAVIAPGDAAPPGSEAAACAPRGRAPRGLPERVAAALDAHLCALDLAGWSSDGHLVVLFGERAPEEARAAASLLVEQIATAWPSCRAGVASYPDDGCDATTLLGAAREATEAAPRAGVAGAEGRVRAIDLGDRTVLIADPAMARLFALIDRLAAADLPVLVCGETGAGKEHAAFSVHHRSARRKGPFVPINCAAIPDTLLEGELFGHAKGAFSGAHAAKAGLFERADGGTLFLDEIGELSLTAQAKLLRVLETGQFVRLGETVERQASVRIVAATNRDLAEEVRKRRFREDLYYRLGSAVVLIPPLRERPADIPVLARRFLQAARERAGKSALTLSPAALLALADHAWPGNVRELKNAMEYVAASVERAVVDRADLPPALGARHPSSGPPAPTPPSPAPEEDPLPAKALAGRDFLPLAEEIEALERRRIQEALAAASGVKTRAARLIAVPERTFRLKLRQYGLG